MLESQKDRAHYTGWLKSHGLNPAEARAQAIGEVAEFRPAFVKGVHRRLREAVHDKDRRTKSA